MHGFIALSDATSCYNVKYQIPDEKDFHEKFTLTNAVKYHKYNHVYSRMSQKGTLHEN